MTRQPHRIERKAYLLVQHLMGAEAFELTAASTEMIYAAEKLVATLLRREQARVRRIIQAQESVSGGYIDKAKLLVALKRETR